MTVHANSREAFASLDLTKRQAAVFAAFASGQWLTDREAKSALGFDDMNEVRPRISEMVEAGHLIEVGKAVDPTTGKRVRICAVRA